MKHLDMSQVKAGDLIAHSGTQWQSVFINLVTFGIPFWGASHVGIMSRCPDGALRMFESTTLENGHPCELSGEVTQGVQAHTLSSVAERYQGRMWVYPLYRRLYPWEDVRLESFLMNTLGRPYDMRGAFRTGGNLYAKLHSLLHTQDLNELFCSELVAAAYSEIGVMPTDNASRWNPNKLVRHLRKREILLQSKRIK